ILKTLRNCMFVSNDEIRQQVVQFVKSIDDFNEPIEKHITHLLEELFPALNIDNEDKVFVCPVDGWLEIPGHFMDDPNYLVNDVIPSPQNYLVNDVIPSPQNYLVNDVIPSPQNYLVNDVIPSPQNYLVNDVISSPQNYLVNDVISSPQNYLVNDVISSPQNYLVNDVIPSPQNYLINDVISSPQNYLVNDVIPSPQNYLVKDVISSPQNYLVNDVISSPQNYLVNDVISSPQNYLVNDVISSPQNYLVNDVISSPQNYLVNDVISSPQNYLVNDVIPSPQNYLVNDVIPSPQNYLVNDVISSPQNYLVNDVIPSPQNYLVNDVIPSPQNYLVNDVISSPQNYLVNGRQKKRWCSMSTLLNFLCGAAVAVEFCHMKNIILRNITAASFIITKDNSVKLFDFSLAIELGKKSEIKDAIGDHFLIPTRWSAPRSLWRTTWSKASDVWMFGHVIYEVVTHGIMPYSHLIITDDEFKKKIFLPAIQLKHEECMSIELYGIILNCTRHEETERMNMAMLQHSLGHLKKNTKVNWTNFPVVTDELRQLAIQFSKGIPKISVDEVAGVSFQLHEELSPSLRQYKDENKNLFRQCVNRHYHTNLLEEINSGKLDDLIPFVKISEHKEKEYICMIRIPVHLEGNILELVYNEKLGKTNSEFKSLLLKIAKLLDTFHKLNFILGSLRSSQLFVQFLPQTDYKIYPVCLGFLQLLDHTSDVQVDDPVAVVRSAPEITDKNIYSKSSDVFAFGVVTLDLFHARSKTHKPDNFSQKTFDEMESEFSYNTLERPINMEPKLFKLIEKCLSQNPDSRPPMTAIIRMLSPKDGRNENFSENVNDGEDSEQMTDITSSHSKSYTMNAINKSESSNYPDASEVASNLGSEYFRNKSLLSNYTPSEKQSKIIPGTTPKEVDTYDDTYDPGRKEMVETNSAYNNVDKSNDDHYYKQFTGLVTNETKQYAQSDSDLLRKKSTQTSSSINPSRRSSIMRSHNFPVSIIKRPHTTGSDQSHGFEQNMSNGPFKSRIPLNFGHMRHLSRKKNEESSYESIRDQAAGNKRSLDHRHTVSHRLQSKHISAKSDHAMRMNADNDVSSPFDLLKDDKYHDNIDHLL
ncbi:hypothetical protein Btru_009752, partial [Bulinus truncatus]